jgi:hypothetical protein
MARAAHVPGPLCRALWSDARHRPLFAVRLGRDARQRDLHRAFIGAVRRGVGARQRVAFAVRPIESARQIFWRTAKAVFPVVRTHYFHTTLTQPKTIAQCKTNVIKIVDGELCKEPK